MTRNTSVLLWRKCRNIWNSFFLIPPFMYSKLTPSFEEFAPIPLALKPLFRHRRWRKPWITFSQQMRITQFSLSNIKRTKQAKLKGVINAAGNSYGRLWIDKPIWWRSIMRWVLQSVDINDGHVGDGIDHSIANANMKRVIMIVVNASSTVLESDSTINWRRW
jgi:hypothetical protein